MVGLLGSGSWATAIVKILLEQPQREVHWWVREPDIIEGLVREGRNPTYLSETMLDVRRLHLTSDIERVVEDCDDLFVVVPSAFLASALEGVRAEMVQGKRFHSAVKGIVPQTNQIVTDFLHQTLGIPDDMLSVVSGPSHAEETARNKLTYLTVASSSTATAERARQLLNCNYVNTTYTTDMRGVEFAAVMKNIYAIAVGLCHGLGFGDNLIAVLISNAVAEMQQFMDYSAPASVRHMHRYAYLGDLLVTCYSQFSRNRTFGNMVGWGYSVKAAQLEMKMVAEGYYAAACVERMRAEGGLAMPIAQAVYNVLYQHADAAVVMRQLAENLK